MKRSSPSLVVVNIICAMFTGLYKHNFQSFATIHIFVLKIAREATINQNGSIQFAKLFNR